MPAPTSAAVRFRPAVWKKSIATCSSNDGELAMSTTTAAFASASAKPSPVMVLTPVFGAAAIASCPFRLSFSTTFDPIRPVPPITTIFMTWPSLLILGDCRCAVCFWAAFVLSLSVHPDACSQDLRASPTDMVQFLAISCSGPLSTRDQCRPTRDTPGRSSYYPRGKALRVGCTLVSGLLLIQLTAQMH